MGDVMTLSWPVSYPQVGLRETPGHPLSLICEDMAVFSVKRFWVCWKCGQSWGRLCLCRNGCGIVCCGSCHKMLFFFIFFYTVSHRVIGQEVFGPIPLQPGQFRKWMNWRVSSFTGNKLTCNWFFLNRLKPNQNGFQPSPAAYCNSEKWIVLARSWSSSEPGKASCPGERALGNGLISQSIQSWLRSPAFHGAFRKYSALSSRLLPGCSWVLSRDMRGQSYLNWVRSGNGC